MSLSIGIVGLPNVGKSTLFKAVTNKQVDIQNYPFTTIDPNVGVVEVPDERLQPLSDLSHSKKIIHATIEFIDIAGLVKGASQGEGLGNKFLANIRETDAIAQVVRAFEDGNITHVHNRIDPADDIGIINTELVMADLETVIKRLDKTSKQVRTDKHATAELVILNKFKAHLESGDIISKLSLHEEEALLAKELNLLTSKKFIYVINVSEKQLSDGFQPDEKLKKAVANSPIIIMSAKLELELSEMTPEDKTELLKEFGFAPSTSSGQAESGLDKLIKESYKTLGLLTFLTTGEDETRAWTAHIGDPIPKASRAIHTDFEKLFIRADVINWKKLLEAGGWSEAKAKGMMHTVGKDYIIQEGDVVEIKI